MENFVWYKTLSKNHFHQNVNKVLVKVTNNENEEYIQISQEGTERPEYSSTLPTFTGFDAVMSQLNIPHTC